MPDLEEGYTLGPYRVEGHLGQGGMATVYKAYQPTLDRYVAIKVLPAHRAHEPGFARRFAREARAAARLTHPHILPVYDFGQEGDLLYIVMQYVEGRTLKEMLGQPMDLQTIADIISQVARALDYAHQRGVIHRDVKPSNVLIDENGWALLADFGLARMMESSEQLTASGEGIGTPAYMSPEQGQGLKVDARTDIYSLGVMLYEMLTGRVPYEAETPMGVILKHISEPLPSPRSLRPDLPEAVEQVVLKATAKKPGDRYASAGEMARALTEALEAEKALSSVERAATVKPAMTEAIQFEGEEGDGMDILRRLSQLPRSIFLEIESLFRLNSRRIEKLILERRERPNLDFKERISWSGEYGGEFSKDVSAIANTGKRGYLIFGVKDPLANRGASLDHLITGIQPGEIRESELVKALRANCTPVPTIEYREIPCRGKLVGVVVIQPATTRPIQIARDCGYKQGLKKGQIFVRQGSGAFAITQVEAGEIVRKYSQRKWQRLFAALFIISVALNICLIRVLNSYPRQEPTPRVTTPIRETTPISEATPTPEVRPPDCPDSHARLTRPGVNAVLSGTVEIFGSADISDFNYYKLEFRQAGSPEWAWLQDSHVPVSDGLLGTWDTSKLPAGTYGLRLTVVDKTGNYPSPCEITVRIVH